MFPLLDRTGPNTTELFQIWLNLPSEDKMVDPYFTMLWDEEIPRLALADDDGRRGELTVIAGAIEGVRPLAAPPDSYASRADSDLAIWHLVLEPYARWVVPPAASPTRPARSTSSRVLSRWRSTPSRRRPESSSAPTSR